MAEQSGAAIEIGLRAMRGVADAAEAAAQIASEYGLAPHLIAAAYHRFDEMIDASWPQDDLSAEMRRLIADYRAFWEESAAHEDAAEERR